MPKYLPRPVSAVLSLVFYGLNTIFWVIPLFAMTLAKLLVPLPTWRRWCSRLLDRIATNWISLNTLNQRLLTPARWDVRGAEDLQPQQWYLVLANHQSWLDILVLQRVFNRKIPFLKFFLKKELIWMPLLGQAWWALDFPFMKRYSAAFLRRHPHLRGRDLEITKRACRKFKQLPVSIMNFVEGTRFSRRKQQAQQSPYQTLLRPRAGGIAFVLASMGQQLDRILDVTISYPRGGGSFWGFLNGRISEIRVQVRSLPIGKELLGDYFNDHAFQQRFQGWLNHLWQDKDQRLLALTQ